MSRPAVTLALSACVVTAALIPVAAQTPIADLAALERRLADTRAVGVFTKLSIKNDATRLHAALRQHHGGRAGPSLDELEERYELLLQQVVVLLKDRDPDLALAIAAARTAIWQSLSNPERVDAP